MNAVGGKNGSVEEGKQTVATEAAPPKTAESAKAEGDAEDSQEEEEGEEGDGEDFNLFYDRDEIESTTEQQHLDAFEDLRDFRRECIISGIIGNKLLNKIDIEIFAPKEDDLRGNQ